MKPSDLSRIARTLMTAAAVLEDSGREISSAAKPKKLSKKAMNSLISKAYSKVADGVVIDIMDIGKVFSDGEKALAADPSGATLEKAIKDIVQKIRKN